MKRKNIYSVMACIVVGVMAPAHAKSQAELKTPAAGVLCDRYVCADASGLSKVLTERHLGKPAAKIFSQGGINLTEFTFANGVFCDVKERLCREDRYFGEDGKRSGAVSKKYTQILFSK